MKKYLVIGNPIEHSLSPQLHNYWFKENNIDAVYEKKQIKESDIEAIISQMRSGEIEGINVTVPFKKSVIPFLDEQEISRKVPSVNTIYKKKDKIIGTNTDIYGFKLALLQTKYNFKGRKILNVLNKENKKLILSINCDTNELDVRIPGRKWRGEDAAKEEFEKNLINDFC